MNPARVLADLVVLIHASYVSFVVIGLALTIYGLARKKSWARNPWFRFLHLAAIGIVVIQAWLGVVCPLTRLENYFRKIGGQEPYPLDFIEYWTKRLMYYEFEPWVFILAYTLFGLAVLATLILGPPRRPAWTRKAS